MSKHPNATFVARCYTIHLVYLIYSLTSLLVTTYLAYGLYLSLLGSIANSHTGGESPLYLSLLNHPINFRSLLNVSSIDPRSLLKLSSIDPTSDSNLQPPPNHIPRHCIRTPRSYYNHLWSGFPDIPFRLSKPPDAPRGISTWFLLPNNLTLYMEK